MKAALKLTKPESMDLETVIEWSKNAAAAAQERCREAREYFDAMRKHYENVTHLLDRLGELDKDDPESEEEAGEIVEAWMDVMEAMEALANERADNTESVALEDEEQRILGTASGQEAAKQLDAEAKAFRNVYFRYKVKFRLDTQEDVARLTGLDRRQISIIERGTNRPQFKTLNRLATAFGISVTELMGQ